MSDPKDFEVCCCFHVTLRKLIKHYRLEQPRVPSQMSDCHSAGTGCGWCIPYLKSIFNQMEEGGDACMKMAAEEYRKQRKQYHKDKSVSPPTEEEVNAKIEEWIRDIPDELKLD